MAIKMSADLDTLSTGYDGTTFTEALQQKNIRRAFFYRSEVEQLLKSLDDPNLRSSGEEPCPYIVVYLLLENDPDPNVTSDRINMAMAGAAPDMSFIYADMNDLGDPDQALIADRPCPPDCPGDQSPKLVLSGSKFQG